MKPVFADFQNFIERWNGDADTTTYHAYYINPYREPSFRESTSIPLRINIFLPKKKSYNFYEGGKIMSYLTSLPPFIIITWRSYRVRPHELGSKATVQYLYLWPFVMLENTSVTNGQQVPSWMILRIWFAWSLNSTPRIIDRSWQQITRFILHSSFNLIWIYRKETWMKNSVVYHRTRADDKERKQ